MFYFDGWIIIFKIPIFFIFAAQTYARGHNILRLYVFCFSFIQRIINNMVKRRCFKQILLPNLQTIRTLKPRRTNVLQNHNSNKGSDTCLMVDYDLTGALILEIIDT